MALQYFTLYSRSNYTGTYEYSTSYDVTFTIYCKSGGTTPNEAAEIKTDKMYVRSKVTVHVELMTSMYSCDFTDSQSISNAADATFQSGRQRASVHRSQSFEILA